MEKRGQGLSLITIILLVLGVVILLFLIYGFSSEWGNMWSKISGFGGGKVNVDVISRVCVNACLLKEEYFFCSEERSLIMEEGKKTRGSCLDFGTNEKFGIDDCGICEREGDGCSINEDGDDLDCDGVVDGVSPVSLRDIATGEKIEIGEGGELLGEMKNFDDDLLYLRYYDEHYYIYYKGIRSSYYILEGEEVSQFSDEKIDGYFIVKSESDGGLVGVGAVVLSGSIGRIYIIDEYKNDDFFDLFSLEILEQYVFRDWEIYKFGGLEIGEGNFVCEDDVRTNIFVVPLRDGFYFFEFFEDGRHVYFARTDGGKIIFDGDVDGRKFVFESMCVDKDKRIGFDCSDNYDVVVEDICSVVRYYDSDYVSPFRNYYSKGVGVIDGFEFPKKANYWGAVRQFYLDSGFGAERVDEIISEKKDLLGSSTTFGERYSRYKSSEKKLLDVVLDELNQNRLGEVRYGWKWGLSNPRVVINSIEGNIKSQQELDGTLFHEFFHSILFYGYEPSYVFEEEKYFSDFAEIDARLISVPHWWAEQYRGVLTEQNVNRVVLSFLYYSGGDYSGAYCNPRYGLKKVYYIRNKDGLDIDSVFDKRVLELAKDEGFDLGEDVVGVDGGSVYA